MMFLDRSVEETAHSCVGYDRVILNKVANTVKSTALFAYPVHVVLIKESLKV